MMFLKSSHVNAALVASSLPKDLNITDPSSIQAVAKTIAEGAMSYYSGNAQEYVDLPQPYYWWECGALFGAMLDYSHYTRDTSYDEVISTALLAQVGPDYNYMLPKHYGDEGNDDMAFWGFGVLSAAERNFAQPESSTPSWLDLGQNLWNSMASRWNMTACNGGLTWQIFASNPNGMNYKNSVSNGGLFQLSARLARATANNTYSDWASKVWDWSAGVGLVDASYNVYDGTDSSTNCSKINQVSFSYSAGIYLYGAAVMANYTGDPVWEQRAAGILEAAKSFFSPFPNATNIMYEHACEQVNTCDTDMQSFKGYLSRFMYASTLMLPSLLPTVDTLLQTTAGAAANACTGGTDGTTCGQKWYVGGFDGKTGLGEEMCALETIQGLLVGESEPPLKAGDIKDVRSSPASATPSATASPTKRSNSAGGLDVDGRVVGLGVLVGLLVWGLA